jgi:hypothetical protein
MDVEEMMQCLMAKMKPQQIMELLLAIQEEIIASQYEIMMARMEVNMDSMKAELISTIKNFKFNEEETTAFQETMEARLEVEEPASVDMTPEVADEEVPVEDAEVTAVGEPKKRRRDGRNLAAVSRQKKKDRILDARCRGKEQGRAQRKNVCLKNSVAALRGTTCRAVVARRRILFTKTTQNRLIVAVRKVPRRARVAWCRRNILRKSWMQRFCGLRKEVTAAGIRITRCSGHRRKGRNKKIVIERNRIRGRESKNERNKGIRSRHVEELLHLRNRRKTAKSIGGQNRRLQPRQENFETGITKRIAGSPVALQMIKQWTPWRGRPPPKRKKQQEAKEEPVM